jgi:CubicO group peptidase (beta-lactamase class C family)
MSTISVICRSCSFFCISWVALASAPAQGQEEKIPIKEISHLVSQRIKSISPGCVVLIAQKGKIVYEEAFGNADMELQIPMKPEMIFRIGSVTKQYTAIAILQLVEQGKIFLEDSIQKFIGDFPYKGHTVTIENLLTHSSGIIDYQALDSQTVADRFYYRKDFMPKQVIDFFKNVPLEFTPGTKFAYSNSNYFLLGYIIERVTGLGYKEYMERNIFLPAGLSHTYYGGYKEIIPNRVSGYAKYSGHYENADYLSMSIPYAAGALMSNAEDMFKWHLALHDYKLVKKESLDKACTPFTFTDGTVSEYGYGWFIKNRNGSKSIEHSGGIDGFQADEIYIPSKDLYIATLYNSLNEGGSDPAFLGLDNEIETLAVGKQLNQEIVVADSILRQYTGIYETDPKHQAVITLENSQLQIEADAGGLPKSPLFAKSDHLFFLKVIDAEIEFVRGSNQQVTQAIIRFKGASEVCKKVK